MNAWFALLKKEFQLSLPAFLMAVIFLGGIFGAAYFLGSSTGLQYELLAAVSTFVIPLHLFSLVFYLFYSLSMERKRLHLWLHNPMAIEGLLSTKLLTGFIYTTITFTVSLTLSVIFFHNLTNLFNPSTMFNLIMTIAASILLFGLSIAITFLFFWSIYLALSQKMNDFFSFILTFILFIILASGYGTFMDLAFMQALTNWGPITVEDIILNFQLEEIMFNYQITLDMTDNTLGGQPYDSSILYMGDFVIGFIKSVILFFISAWIIDKKVEV